MIALYFLACLAVASAAPYYGHHQGHRYGHYESAPYRDHEYDLDSESIFANNLFDARRFWAEMEAEMHRFDQMMNEFYKHFPVTSSQVGVQGDEYVVVVNMNGFDEKDIKVKAKEGVLMIQAIHKTDDGSERSYLDLKTLPSYVNVNGTWTYDTGVLKIVFPLNNKPEDVTEAAITEGETLAPRASEGRDREEMDPEHAEQPAARDADVGLAGVDNSLATSTDDEILTNVIPKERVEATTYAVDLKNEVEFVPIKY